VRIPVRRLPIHPVGIETAAAAVAAVAEEEEAAAVAAVTELAAEEMAEATLPVADRQRSILAEMLAAILAAGEAVDAVVDKAGLSVPFFGWRSRPACSNPFRFEPVSPTGHARK
jgi:hypothetical protein